MNNRLFTVSIGVFLALSSTAFSADSTFCTADNFQRLSMLYENRSSETARSIFSILDCGSNLSRKTRRAQYVALIGGFMQKNPELIDDLYASAQSAHSLEAPKVFLDSLWFCATKTCQERLQAQPFSLPKKDVEALFRETPPDPYSLSIATPESIDLLWGYFTGTGDTQIVQRIFEFVRSNWKSYDASVRIGAEQRMLIESARWSLVSMAAQNQRVKSVLESSRSDSPEAAKLLEEVEKEPRE